MAGNCTTRQSLASEPGKIEYSANELIDTLMLTLGKFRNGQIEDFNAQAKFNEFESLSAQYQETADSISAEVNKHHSSI